MRHGLRGPTGLPDLGEPDEPNLLAALKATERKPPVRLVLHGPPGIGKSALAAGISRYLMARRTTSSGSSPQVHWIALGGHAGVERTLLRLLAECGAPRRPIVRAALAGGSAFQRELLSQCEVFVRGRIVVLDDVGPSVGRSLLAVLRQCRELTVIVTSRQRYGWTGTGARLYAVRPLHTAHAVALAASCSTRLTADGWAVPQPLGELLTAAQGVPPLARLVGSLAAEVPPGLLRNVAGPDELVALALDRCSPDELRVLRNLAARSSGAPFTARTVESLFQRDTDPADVPVVLSGLLNRELVQQWRGNEAFCLSAPVADWVRRRTPPRAWRRLARQVARDVAKAAGQDLQDTASLLDGRARPHRPDGWQPDRIAPHELAARVDEFMDLLADNRHPKQQKEEIADALALLLATRTDAHRLVALHHGSPGSASVRRALGSLVRDLGMPARAQSLLDGDTSAYVVYETAANRHQLGRLGSALAGLGEEPASEDAHAAWQLLVRGAVLCDQGKALEADRVLRRAAELHRVAGCPRGRGWALLYLARACLLRGLNSEAEHLLRQADQALLSVGTFTDRTGWPRSGSDSPRRAAPPRRHTRSRNWTPWRGTSPPRIAVASPGHI